MDPVISVFLGYFYHMFLDLFFIIATSNLLRTGTEHEPLGCSAVVNPRFKDVQIMNSLYFHDASF